MIAAIVGGLGCGKTMLLTAIAHDAHVRRQNVFANYYLAFPHTPVRAITDLEDLRRGVVVFDELWIFADSRRWSSQQNQIMDRFLLQSRKRFLDFYFTTQSFHQVDIRIRGVTDQLLAPRMIRDKDKVPIGIVYSIFKADAMGNLVYRRKASINVVDIKGEYRHDEIIYGFDTMLDDLKKGEKQVKRFINVSHDHGLKCLKVPYSGHYQDLIFDVQIFNHPRPIYVDVISIYKAKDKYISINTGSKIDAQRLLENAETNYGIPYYAFENDGSWFFLPITDALIEKMGKGDAYLKTVEEFVIDFDTFLLQEIKNT